MSPNPSGPQLPALFDRAEPGSSAAIAAGIPPGPVIAQSLKAIEPAAVRGSVGTRQPLRVDRSAGRVVDNG
jgi:hypothetical protein